jgi:gluconolactonase
MRTLPVSTVFCSLAFFLPRTVPAQDYGYAQGDVPAAIAAPGAKVSAVVLKHPETGRALGLCDGIAVDPAGNVYFSEPAADVIYKVFPEGKAIVFYAGHGDAPNGLDIDPQGRLVAGVTGALLRFGADGKADTLAKSPDFKSIADLAIGSDGSIYATNLYAGHALFRVSADGRSIQANTSVPNPDGVKWLESKKILYVSDRDAHTTWQFDVAADGGLSGKRPYVPDIPGAGGIALDEREDVYIAGFEQGAVHVYSPGKKDPFLGHILVKGSPTPKGNDAGQAFGGPDGKTLYITGNGGLFQIRLNVKGLARPVSSALARPAGRGARPAPGFAPASMLLFGGDSPRDAVGRRPRMDVSR